MSTDERTPTEHAPHPDTPEWAVPMARDLSDAKRGVLEVVSVVKHWIGETLALKEQYRRLEIRVRKIERWRQDTSEEPTQPGGDTP